MKAIITGGVEQMTWQKHGCRDGYKCPKEDWIGE